MFLYKKLPNFSLVAVLIYILTSSVWTPWMFHVFSSSWHCHTWFQPSCAYVVVDNDGLNLQFPNREWYLQHFYLHWEPYQVKLSCLLSTIQCNFKKFKRRLVYYIWWSIYPFPFLFLHSWCHVSFCYFPFFVSLLYQFFLGRSACNKFLVFQAIDLLSLSNYFLWYNKDI